MKIKTKDMILASLFAALMAVGAFVKIPFPFVPVTFQPFVCALAGMILGSRLGTISQGLYVAIGLLGVPIFTNGGGLTYIFNPTFGYLVGFIAATFVIGKISENQKELNFSNSLLAVMSGLLIINIIGVPYFYLIENLYLNQDISARYVISVVFFPYFVKDLVLYVLVAATSVKIVPILRKNGLVNS